MESTKASRRLEKYVELMCMSMVNYFALMCLFIAHCERPLVHVTVYRVYNVPRQTKVEEMIISWKIPGFLPSSFDRRGWASFYC